MKKQIINRFLPLSLLLLSGIIGLNAQVTTINYDDSLDPKYVDKVVPDNASSLYIKIKGADGGRSKTKGYAGGQGATVEGTLTMGDGTYEVPAGSTIRFIIGEAGESHDKHGGGGGGTAVALQKAGESTWTLLMVAGGGGGAGSHWDGRQGTVYTEGSNGIKMSGNKLDNAGSNGYGGTADDNASYGGGGAYGDADGDHDRNGKKGIVNDIPTGSEGGSDGDTYADGGFGFGSGGAGAEDFAGILGSGYSGGGGGGYSGGGGGDWKGGGGGGGTIYKANYFSDAVKEDHGTTSSPSDGYVEYEYEYYPAPTVSCLESTTLEVYTSIDAESLIESAENADTYAFDDGASSRTYTCDQIDNTFTETLTVSNDYGSSTCEVIVSVENSSSNSTSTWTGAESSNWKEACNWSTYIVPNSSTEVTIPATTNDPVISANTSVKSLEIEASANVTIEHSYTLTIDNYADIGATVYGTLTNNGVLKIDNTGSSALVASGSDAQINLYGDTYIGVTSGNIGGEGIMLEDGATLNITNTGDDNKPYLIIDETASSGILISNSTMNATLEQTTKPQVMVRIGSNLIGENGLVLAGNSTYTNNGAEIEIGNAERGIEIASTATFENTADAQVTIGDLGPLSKNGIYVAGTFSNEGTVTIKNASYPELFGGENWDNTNGSLMVDGQTFGLTYVDGTLAPGSSLGTLTTDGSLDLAGTLEIEVEGTTAGTEYDVLEVSGDLTLTGASLSTNITYTASQDDRIVFVTYSGSLSGTFSTDLPSDWELDYSVSGEIAIVYSATN